MNFRKSIAAETLLKMALRIAIVVVITSVLGYFHLAHTIETKSIESVQKYIKERGDREKILFEMAEKNHELLKSAFLDAYSKNMKNPHLLDSFYALAKKQSDGTYRSDKKTFNGKTDTGIFVARDIPITNNFANRIVSSFQVTDRFGLGYHHQFQDTYFTFPESALVLFWPEFPSWIPDTEATMNIPAEEYHAVSAPEQNPDRKTAWTGLFYDKVSKIWMVTAATPIYDGDHYIASVHHDVMVNEILDRTINDRLDGAINYIVREDGRLIAHPNYLESIKKSDGKFDLLKSTDVSLKEQFGAIKNVKGHYGIIESPDGHDYLAVAKIPGPDWYFVTVYPKSIIQKSAANSAGFILIAGILSLLLEVTILFFVLRKQISVPLLQFIQAVEKVTQGQLLSNIDLKRQDELGVLAKSFNKMTSAIKERDDKLEDHAKGLERLVEERTRELDEQKTISLQASKMSALGEMAGGIAHEINTPLATIKMLSSQLNKEIQSDLPDLDNLSNQLQKIEATTDRVAKIVRGLKSFARDGNNDPMENANVNKIIQETIELCSEQLKIHGVDLKFEMPHHDIYFQCRSVQISQVLLNLVMNAHDAVENQSEKWIQIEAKEDSEWVEIRVTDSGPGISQQNQEKIFQPFFTTKAIGKGTGMGLSISLGIVRSHLGKLFIDSASKNTCFVMRIPRGKRIAA